MSIVALTFSLYGCATSGVTSNRRPAGSNPTRISDIGTLIEYQNGILKVEMDTCGNKVFPVVHFKPLEEVLEAPPSYGSYSASITNSVEINPDTTCPYNAPQRFEIDLKKRLREWAFSSEGTQTARALFEKGGEIEIAVSNFLTSIDYKASSN
jgi:hypothetical protein